jgi:EAL domain-containing protein (putative c-di-GMP-specific phosphodiesterase class I)
MCVNLSARQLSDEEFVEEVRGLLARTETDPHSFGLEVTESVLIENERALAALEELRGMGITVSIDDFGTGYSSLSYLKEFPADHVKIDCSFVKGLGEDPEKTVMVPGIVTLAHATSKQVVAECVESVRQLVLLEDMGCEMGQGHYFSEAPRRCGRAARRGIPSWSPATRPPVKLRARLGGRAKRRDARGSLSLVERLGHTLERDISKIAPAGFSTTVASCNAIEPLL